MLLDAQRIVIIMKYYITYNVVKTIHFIMFEVNIFFYHEI